jgi:hypothetical protein
VFGVCNKIISTGLTQIRKLTQQFEWKIPIRALELTQILGQPCEFQATGEVRREPPPAGCRRWRTPPRTRGSSGSNPIAPPVALQTPAASHTCQGAQND